MSHNKYRTSSPYIKRQGPHIGICARMILRMCEINPNKYIRRTKGVNSKVKPHFNVPFEIATAVPMMQPFSLVFGALFPGRLSSVFVFPFSMFSLISSIARIRFCGRVSHLESAPEKNGQIFKMAQKLKSLALTTYGVALTLAPRIHCDC